MKIISKRKRIETVHRTLCFDWPGERHCGCAFECDEHGNVDESKLHPVGLANFRKCLAGNVDGRPIGKPYISIAQVWVIEHLLYDDEEEDEDNDTE